MTEKLGSSPFFRGIFDRLIPFTTWVIITFPIWFSFFHPALVAYFIIGFDLFFFYKAIQTSYYALKSYRRILKHDLIRYDKLLIKQPKSKDIKHFVIIPNYKEPIYKLESTIQSLAQSDYPHKSVYLVLGFEKRENDAQEKAQFLSTQYRNLFADIIVAYHPLTANEVPGKASNQTFAAKAAEQYAVSQKFDKKDILITICDADSHLSKNYFSYLTHSYLADPEREYHFYWASVLFYNNFIKLPFFVRIQATLSSIVLLAFLSQTDKLIQTSTYSTNLWLLSKIKFWDVDIIPEDWHIYLQAFFMFGDRVKTIPLYTFVNCDAVYSGGILKTFANRYEQEKRWAWGASDIGYALKRSFTSPHISPLSKIRKILFIVETHLMWPISFFILTLSASIPPLINPSFKRTVLGFLLPRLSGFILTTASVLLILFVYLDLKIRERIKHRTELKAYPFLIFQWYLLPVITFFLSSLPALEAHTRLLLGKKIKYKVTEKV